MYKIPLTNSPNQTLRFTVPVNDENKTFMCKLSFNEQANYWTMSLFDSYTEEEIISCIPLLSSQYKYANILRQQGYMRIGAVYIAPINETPNSAPDADDLGTNYVVIWGDNEMSEYDQYE